MDIQDAIGAIENNWPGLYKGLALAIEALREKQAREKGCPCCNGYYPDKLGEKVYVWSVHYYEIGNGEPNYIKSAYCPMCGKKLGETK